MKNIAIFLPSFIGDSISATPAIKIIEQSYPNANIHLVCKPLVAPLFTRCDKYNVIIYDRSKNKVNAVTSLITRLKQEKIEACALLNNKFIDALIAKLAYIKIIAGYKNEFRGFLLTHKLKIDRSRHYINRYAYIANLLCNNEVEELPQVVINYDTNKSLLPQTGNLKVGLSILSPAKINKHYSVDKTIETIQLLNQQHNNIDFYLFGSPAESNEAQKVLNGCNKLSINNITNLAGKTTVEELVDSIATLDFLISVDSSPLHIASACGVNTLALVGKSPSPFSVVCPISKLVKVVHNSGVYIADGKQMLSIRPSDIVEEFENHFKKPHNA